MIGQSPLLNPPCFLLQRTGSGSSLSFPLPQPQEFAPRNWAKGHLISGMTSLGPGYHCTGTQGLTASSGLSHTHTPLCPQPHQLYFCLIHMDNNTLMVAHQAHVPTALLLHQLSGAH